MNPFIGKDYMQKLYAQSKNTVKKILPIDTTLFILQFLRHPQDIGSVAPSSKALAESMTRFVTTNTETPKLYLEVGAGTGAFTKAIIKKLRPKDKLDIVEINPKFCERLQKKYADRSNVMIHNGSILDWKPEYLYDGIISSLPFNVFNACFVSRILTQFANVAKAGAVVSYCEYMVLPDIKKFFLAPKSKKAFQETLETTATFEKKHQIQLDKVFANLPPAMIHHCQF